MTERPVPQKSSEAFRTISEVAEELKLPQHVLRFWETRFPQVKPLKRAGGRRFYRPEDVALLRTVRTLLYGEGYTIKGVQRLLAELGARQVSDALGRAAGAGPDGPGIGLESGDVGPDGVPEAPHDGAARSGVTGPIQPSHAAVPPRAGGDIVVRLERVLADLDECGRLLSSLDPARG